MDIRISYPDREYGRYNINSYSISVHYDFYNRDSQYVLKVHEEITKELESILLGQQSPVNICCNHHEVIVYAGETFSKLHIRVIKAQLYNIDFTNTPWVKKINKLKEKYKYIRDRDVFVRVSFFSLSNTSYLRGGSFSVSTNVAKWLGEQLVMASYLDNEWNGASAYMKEDD